MARFPGNSCTMGALLVSKQGFSIMDEKWGECWCVTDVAGQGAVLIDGGRIASTPLTIPVSHTGVGGFTEAVW